MCPGLSKVPDIQQVVRKLSDDNGDVRWPWEDHCRSRKSHCRGLGKGHWYSAVTSNPHHDPHF